MEAIHTYDDKWAKFVPLIGIPIEEPRASTPPQAPAIQ